MKFVYLFASSLFSLAAMAQPMLRLRITDAQKKPLPQATISTQAGRQLTVANDAGEASLRLTTSEQSIAVRISYAGYQQLDTLLTATSQPIVLVLLPVASTLDAVEVKALRAGQFAPFSKTDLTANTIAQNNLGQDIPMLLNQTPSVVANSDAGNGIGYTGLRIRGTDATRINMTINGIPYNDAESQGIFFVNLPDLLSSATSIQVQRGVGTSSNGGGAFGATLNVSTHQYNPEPYAEINSAGGSFNSWKNTVKAGTGLLGKHFTLDGRISRISSDGYIDRASSLLQSGMLSAGWWGKKTTVKANAILGSERTYQAWYGVSQADLANNRTVNYAGTEKPGEPYANETDNYKQNHYQLIINHQLKPGTLFNTSFFASTGKGYYEQYKAEEDPLDYGLKGLAGTGGTPVDETDLIRRLWLDNIFYGQVFSLQKKRAGSEWNLGGGWSMYNGDHYGDVIWTAIDPNARSRWYNLDANKADAHLYTKWQKQLNNPAWHLFADLQYRYVHYELNGFRNAPDIRHNAQWHFVNPKAGITYQRGGWNAYLSYATGNKEPNRDDFEVSTSALPKREQLHDVELHLDRKNLLPHLNIGLTNYLMWYKDQLVLTGKVNDVGAYTRTNIPKSYRAGMEWDVQYQRTKWQARYVATFSLNRVIDFTEFVDDYDNGGQIAINRGTQPMAFSPAVIQQISLSYQPVNNLQLTWMTKHTGRQYLDNSGLSSRSLDPFIVSDVHVAYTLPAIKGIENIQLLAQLNNLFSARYEPNGYTFSYLYGGSITTENYYYPMAGFNAMVALNIRF